jgi:hypothetical protein
MKQAPIDWPALELDNMTLPDGRRRPAWLHPRGCAATSAHVRLDLLGQPCGSLGFSHCTAAFSPRL